MTSLTAYTSILLAMMYYSSSVASATPVAAADVNCPNKLTRTTSGRCVRSVNLQYCPTNWIANPAQIWQLGIKSQECVSSPGRVGGYCDSQICPGTCRTIPGQPGVQSCEIYLEDYQRAGIDPSTGEPLSRQPLPTFTRAAPSSPIFTRPAQPPVPAQNPMNQGTTCPSTFKTSSDGKCFRSLILQYCPNDWIANPAQIWHLGIKPQDCVPSPGRVGGYCDSQICPGTCRTFPSMPGKQFCDIYLEDYQRAGVNSATGEKLW